MKRKLLLAALCVVGAMGGVNSLSAQTDVTSTYLTNADFEGSYTTPYHPNGDRDISQPNGWTLTYSNGVNYDSSILEETQATYSNISGQVTIPGDGRGDQTYAVRFHNNGSSQLITLAQESKKFKKGKYTLSGFFRSQNQNELEIGFYFNSYSNENRRKFDKGNGAWKTYTTLFELDDDSDIVIGVFFKHTTGNQMVAGVDNIKLTYENINGPALALLIAQANAVNSKLGTLTSAIASAQSVYDGINNTEAYQENIDNAISTLQTAINNAISGYSFNPAGDDVSTLLMDNPGFDIDINFPASSSTATSANTVYATYGWTPTVPGNCTGATIGYGYSRNINGSGNVTAPTQNADGTTAGGALAICVGWSGQVTYKSLAKTFPAGSYRITYRAYNGNTKNTTAVEAIPLVGFVPTSGDSQINSTTETFTNQDWSTHTYDFELASDTEGQIQIGLKPTENTNSYNAPELFIDEVKLTYFDPLKLAQIQWQEAWDALYALDETALPDAAETAITTTLAETEPTTVDGYNTAKAALQALIDSYDGIKAAYDNALALIDLATDEMTNSTGTKDDIETAISTATTDIENRTSASDLISDYNTLEAARRTYVTSGAQPTFGHSFDWTFKMDNPDFEDGTSGWTNERNTTGQYNYGTTPTAMQHGTNGLDVWAPQINYINVYQSQTLPAGVYELSAYVFSSNPYKQHVYAHNGKDNPSADLTSKSEWQKLAVTFINTEDVSTKLGLYSQGKNQNNNTDGWFRLDNFQLLYQGNYASATMRVKAGQWGTFIAPFDVAIPDGVNAYTVTGVNASDYMVKEAVETTIPANTPVLLENTTENLVDTTFYGKNISEADSYTEGLLTGIYTAATIPAGSYVLQTPNRTGVQAFYPLASDLTGGTPNRCYLTLPASAAKRNAIFFDKEEGTTSIEAPNATNGEDGVFYNLAGQRVNRSYKGIIIHNRKAKLNN